jgi:hypothetical protein
MNWDNILKVDKILIGILKNLFKLFLLNSNSNSKYYLNKFLNLVQNYFTQVYNIIS